MKHVLQKADRRLVAESLGAELQSLVIGGKEWLWNADPAWWPRHSPILFPTVGKSRNDRIQVDGAFHTMPQHGFARDMEFVLDEKNSGDTTLCFRLYDSGETLQTFPFPFELGIVYTLQPKGVHVRYELFNPGNRTLPFALGAHPAFLLPDKGFQDLRLRFSEEESFERHLLKDGLFNGEAENLGIGKELGLSGPLFDKDAIVLKNIRSRKIELTGPVGTHGGASVLEMQFGGFEDLGIWTKPGCDRFLCLEPWHGHADSSEGPDDLMQRAGVHQLEPGKTWEGFWQVTFHTH